MLSLDSANVEANQALGRVQMNGRWVSEEESYRGRGYVQLEGEWMTAAQREAIERQRAALAQSKRRAELEARVREAEERAAKAEAEAAAAKAPDVQGIPLWWGTWGPGPLAWPTWPSPTPSPAEGPR